MRLIRKNYLLTKQYSITTNTHEEDAMCHIELCNVIETKKDSFKEEAALEICLGYDELDDLIAVLQHASDALKRHDQR